MAVFADLHFWYVVLTHARMHRPIVLNILIRTRVYIFITEQVLSCFVRWQVVDVTHFTQLVSSPVTFTTVVAVVLSVDIY